MNGEIAMYILSAIIIVLGGVSLFIQKIYKINKGSGGKTVVNLPFFGMLTTNYPALVFVFIGAALAAYTFKTTNGANVPWLISGEFKAPQSQLIDWSKGSLLLSPRQFQTSIKADGTFEILGDIEKGRKFEDVVKQITYTNYSNNGLVYCTAIKVVEEYDKFKQGKSNILDYSKGKTRRYKPIDVSMAKMAKH